MEDRTCTVTDCEREPVARGWCLKHYKRERRRLGGSFPRLSPAERLAARLKRMPNGCLEWQGSRIKGDGHGNIYVSGKATLAHRLAWELENGPIPDGMLVCHRCDNPPCCDVTHLFLGTYADNARDMVAKRRHMNNRRTHCQNGHEFSTDNTATDARGNRRCIACSTEYQRNYYLEKRKAD